MHKIRIGNKRNGDRGFYVGRPTPLGNPFIIGRDGTRDEVIAKYHDWLTQQMVTNPLVQSCIRQLVKAVNERDICLTCWCTPLPCHADIIKAKIVEIINNAT